MAETPIADVSDTALWVATYRAMEGERPDALFQDPLASRLAGEKGKTIARTMAGSRYTRWSVVIRTCVIDDYVRDLVARGVDTVINLGAGLDTRPYRLNLPESLHWIEVDYPHMVALKNERLRDEKPRCRLERVPLDLADDAARRQFLTEAGARGRNILIITEGVLPYLSNEQVAQLAKDLLAQPSFRHWIVDYFAPHILKFMQSGRRQQQMRNAPFRFMPDNFTSFFATLGWQAHTTRYLAEESLCLGRAIPTPWWTKILVYLTPKHKRRAYLQSLGYVLLEPKLA